MVDAKYVVSLTISALVIIIIFAVAPMIGSTIDDTYDVPGNSTSGWNATYNTDLDNPAETWGTFVGLIILAFLAVIIGILIIAFKGMGGKE